MFSARAAFAPLQMRREASAGSLVEPSSAVPSLRARSPPRAYVFARDEIKMTFASAYVWPWGLRAAIIDY